MKRALATLLLLLPLAGWASVTDSLWWNRDASYLVPIEQVAVVARRPLARIGEQQTLIDSAALRSNVALSIADVLTYNSSLFVKQYGRATLSTVAFRGTSPSHTQVLWNGMKVQSPMLGMTDLSMIPAYLVDRASLLHGPSSVGITGGGLGGAIRLESRPEGIRGAALQFVQGVGSFSTFDDYLRFDYGSERWALSTRVAYSSSKNDFKYTNYKRKEYLYDDEHQIVGSYYPEERNRNGAFRDLHLMQQLYYTTTGGDRIGLDAWYLNSKRGVPLLSVDYRDERKLENELREETLRGVIRWEHRRSNSRLELRGGYAYSHQGYEFARDRGNGWMTRLSSTRSTTHTLYAEAEAEWFLSERWSLKADLCFNHYRVESLNRITEEGYREHRSELSALVSARWAISERLGAALSLREELCGEALSLPIPLLGIDYLLSRKGNLMLKGSLTRNYRFPTLNDLYFLPGGNPDLRPEEGLSYDLGLSFSVGKEERYRLRGEVVWFDSYIDNWIIWLPTSNGFWHPRNVKRVHAYGVELSAEMKWQPARDWQLSLSGSFSWSPSINEGDPLSWSDHSIGKQLVYIPEYSASVVLRTAWRSWRLSFESNYYSERYTSSDNNTRSELGVVDPYTVSSLSLEKRLAFSWADLSLKGMVSNLFDREYESVLSRPMPGIHVEFFLEIRPKWGKNR